MWLDRLKEMKSNSGLTTKQIAAQSGLPEPTLIKLFAGVTKDPKLTTVQQLVHFFGHTLDDLVDSPATKKPQELILSDIEKKMILDFRSLDDSGRELVLHVLANAVPMHSGKNKAVSDMETAQ